LLHRLLAPLLLAALAACQPAASAPPPAALYTAEQVATLRQYGFEEEGDNWLLGLDSKLLFPSDGSMLEQDQVRKLGEMSGALLRVGIGGVSVEGHADSTGQATYNQQLSLRRAEAVKTALVAGGMREDAVQAVGWGDTRPIESNATAAGRKENRRVVVIVSPDDVIRY